MLYLIQNPKTAYRVIDGEGVIVHLDSSMLYSLNPVATLIWKMCDEKTTVKEIVDNFIKEEFEVESEVAEKDCLEFVHDFIDKGLLLQRED